MNQEGINIIYTLLFGTLFFISVIGYISTVLGGNKLKYKFLLKEKIKRANFKRLLKWYLYGVGIIFLASLSKSNHLHLTDTLILPLSIILLIFIYYLFSNPDLDAKINKEIIKNPKDYEKFKRLEKLKKIT